MGAVGADVDLRGAVKDDEAVDGAAVERGQARGVFGGVLGVGLLDLVISEEQVQQRGGDEQVEGGFPVHWEKAKVSRRKSKRSRQKDEE